MNESYTILIPTVRNLSFKEILEEALIKTFARRTSSGFYELLFLELDVVKAKLRSIEDKMEKIDRYQNLIITALRRRGKIDSL